jgi:PKD repeat protein
LLYHYAIPGIYDVSYTAYGPCDDTTVSRNDWIILSDALNSVDFTVAFAVNTAQDTATFTFADSSDGVIIDRIWRFVSTNPLKDTTLTNPSGNTIKLPIDSLTSTYKVWLTIRNECDTIFDTLSIAVDHL